MNKHISNEYNDKWKNFIKHSLRNIDYLVSSFSDQIIDDIMYKLEPITINQGSYVFKRGTQ